MRAPLRGTLVALATAAVIALLELHRTTVAELLRGGSATPHEILRRVLPMWLTVVIASPWCAWMARRFPFRLRHVGRTLLAHVGGAAVFVALHMALMILFHTLVTGAHVSPLPGLVHRYVFYVAMEMSVYGAIVLVVMLFDARREAAERDLATARVERDLTASRLESLRAQLRPHFLFNTLNALAVLARRGDGAEVDRAIGDLGELLRASFDTRDVHEIPLRDELGFLERYLSLQRIRFPDRLAVEWQVADETRAALVPPLLVQPLVENALEHGLATSRGGHMRVAARRDGEMLEIEVDDDGP
ncbi:MAG TPA: histidine kinase, partial [Candidatus Eisenbacteria bacterium]|nr:histidine kinase [Candidatus Eisenbacteria bacterium]